MPADDLIRISGLKTAAWVGVPEEERAHPQALELELELEPKRPLAGLGDDLGRTVNYYEAACLAREVALARPRQLIETLAEDVADALLARFPLRRVTVEVRKFILPHCGHVAVRVGKTRPS